VTSPSADLAPSPERRQAQWARLDPELAAVLARFPQGFDPGEHLADMDVVQALRSTPDLMAGTGASLPTDDRVDVANRMIDGPAGPGALGLRVYTPKAASSPMPAVVFSHGGAFILGDTYSEEHRCLRYAAEAGCVVVSVEWRHAPEHPFPAGVEDAYGALGWTLAIARELGVDTRRVAVAGVSSGGAFAAASALMARDRGQAPPLMQLLVYPVVDDRLQSASMREFDATPLWTRLSSTQMWEHYLGPVRAGEPSPYAAPARATDLSGLPPAYVMVAELDPLRDEAVDYARRLLEAGVPTELHCFAGTCHGFDIVAPDTEVGRCALDEQVRVLRRAFTAAPA
jgi:acetyl esterase